MKVVHIIDKIGIAGSPIHGPSRLLLALWPELLDRGIDLQLWVLREETEAAKQFYDAGVNIKFFGRHKLDPRTAIDLVKEIKRAGCDILHLHGYGATTFGRLAAHITSARVIVHEHMVDASMPVYQSLADRLLSHWTDAGVAVSGAVSDFMVVSRHIPQSLITTIPNTVQTSYHQRPSEDTVRALRREFGLTHDDQLIGAIGRLHSIKGFNYLIDAFDLLRRDLSHVHLVLVGDGDERSLLESQVRSLDLVGNVHFAGHQEDVRPYLGAIDVLVLSSLSEGCPLSLLEGLSFGVPIVATNVGGIPEVLEGSGAGIMVDPMDAQQLKHALVRVLENKELADEMSIGAKKKFVEDFAVSVITDRYVAQYRRILDR